MKDTLSNRFEQGDFVEHKAAPNVVWEIMALDRYDSGGPRATLRYIGGDALDYATARRIFNVFGPGARVTLVRDLVDANPMLTLAVVAGRR